MVLKFETNLGFSKLEVPEDCYMDELFASLESISLSVSDDECCQMMKDSDMALVNIEQNQIICFGDYVNSDAQIVDAGVSGEYVYRYMKIYDFLPVCCPSREYVNKMLGIDE